MYNNIYKAHHKQSMKIYTLALLQAGWEGLKLSTAAALKFLYIVPLWWSIKLKVRVLQSGFFGLTTNKKKKKLFLYFTVIYSF